MMMGDRRSRWIWVVSLLGLLGLGGCATAPPQRPQDACAIFDEKPSWYRAARKAEAKWGTPVQVQLAIIRAESGFRQFGLGAQVLRELGIRRIRVITDNPRKIIGVSGFGIEVAGSTPIEEG
jgi:hypothetical protein